MISTYASFGIWYYGSSYDINNVVIANREEPPWNHLTGMYKSNQPQIIHDPRVSLDYQLCKEVSSIGEC